LLTKGFELIASTSSASDGRDTLTNAFGLCPGQLTEDDADGERLSNYVLLAYDDYAMGNYPFESNYISGSSPLPAYPMRVACALLSDNAAGDDYTDDELLQALGLSVNLLYNASQQESCFDLPPRDDEGQDGIWDVQWCTELMCQETYFTRRPPSLDMGVTFPNYDFNMTWINQHCASTLGASFVPRQYWMTNSYYGGLSDDFQAGMLPLSTSASNIVFTNGEFDPWRAAGVSVNNTAKDIIALFVPSGAHHLDLMFATPTDPPGLKQIREAEIAYAIKWGSQS
jgi:lysosomal Pro-X carboxypeptidase